MSTTLQAKSRTARMCRNAVMLALAFAFSWLEHMLPLSLFLPLPGVKLGLANVVTVALFYLIAPVDAAVISVLRIGLSALLFGTPISLFFSLLGGAFSYLALWACRPFFGRVFSMIGVSVLSATGHHIGQITAAIILFDTGVILSYLPVLLLAGVVTGGVTGVVLNLCERRLRLFSKKG